MFISTAFAQAAAAAPAKTPSMLESFIPIVAIFAIFYFLVLRPQAKRQKEHQGFLTQIKRGDSVITTGGIYGKVEGVTDKFVTLEVSEGVNIRILKNQVAAPVQDGGANV